MAHLGRFERFVTDTSGNAQSGASVEVRKRGATVDGAQSGVTTVNVRDPGAIVAGDTVQVNGEGTGYSVSSVSATTVVVGSAVTVANLDRLSPSTNLPTLYDASDGGTTKTNPLTTDSEGMAFAYVAGGQYDGLISGTGLTTTLRHDIPAHGDSVLGNALTTPVFIMDTLRTVSGSNKVLSVRNATSEVFYVDASGHLKSHTVDGAVTITSGGLSITTGGATIVAGGLNVTAGGAEVGGDIIAHDNITIGPLGSVDCNLYRLSANVLKTDDALTVAGALTASGYLRFANFQTITVSSATLTIPSTGNVFFCTAAGAQTVTTISGGPGNGFPVFLIAATGTFPITFDTGDNIVDNGNVLKLDDATGSANATGIIFVTDGTNWYAAGRSTN